MKINATQRFRDGHATYEEGAEYDVPDLDGARFVGSGWATSPDYSLPGVAPAPEVVDIEPASTTHEANAEETQP